MKFKVSQEDVNATKVLEPTWYDCVITSVSEGQSKSSGGDMITIKMKVSDAPGNPKLKDGTTSAHVPLKPYYITEAGVGFALGFYSALSGKQLKVGDEIDSELLANARGRHVRVMVENEEYAGRVGNVAKDFAGAK